VFRHCEFGGFEISRIAVIFNANTKWISAYAPQGYSDFLSAKALEKSYAGMTGKENNAVSAKFQQVGFDFLRRKFKAFERRQYT
jgi:hypothetical protein